VKLLHCILLGLLVIAVAACGPSRSAADAKADLNAPDAEVRLKAARDIEYYAKEQTLPADIVDTLLTDAEKESDIKVKASMIIALGYLGEQRAEPMIRAFLETDDPIQQRWAGRAWSWYLIRTGKFEEGHKFPPRFPYGTEGFPPPAEK
jgi:hypothetical protein